MPQDQHFPIPYLCHEIPDAQSAIEKGTTGGKVKLEAMPWTNEDGGCRVRFDVARDVGPQSRPDPGLVEGTAVMWASGPKDRDAASVQDYADANAANSRRSDASGPELGEIANRDGVGHGVPPVVTGEGRL